MVVIQRVCTVHSMTGVMLSVFLTWLVVVNGKAIELNVANAQYTYSTYIAIASYSYTII